MLSLDLFNSKYEKPLQEGAVSTVDEQASQNPEQSKYVANFNEFNTPENIAAVRDVWTRIQAHFMDDDSTWQWLTLKWPDGGEAVTLSPNQVFSILKKIASMSNQRQKVTLLTNFGDRNSFLSWLSGVKIVPRPVPKKDVPKGQQSFDLKEAEKKSSDNPKFKSTQLDRLKTQARAKYPSASSDLEALAADFVDQQEQDQKSLTQVRGVNTRQDDLIRQITALNKEQDQEISSLASDEAQLQKNIQQLQAANATLAQKLSAMSQRRDKTTTDVIPGPTPAADATGPGVSVASDKQVPQRDQRLVQYAKRLRQQIKNLELQVALKAPQDQQAMRQEIDTLRDQLAQLLNRPEQLAQPSLATTTLGGQQADVLAGTTPAAGGPAGDAEFTDVDFTTINPEILARIKDISDKSKSVKKSTKKKTKAKDPEFELTPESQSVESIPLKSVVQGYQVDYDPKTRRVTVSQRGQVIGSGINRLNSAKYHLTLINKIIDRAEDDKYPTDIDDRDVALPMRTATEGSVFGQQKFDTQMDLAKLKSQLTQPKPAQTAPVSANIEPQPVAYRSPDRLSTLQLRKQRVDNLADIKKLIEKLQAQATRGGRELPPGLAADLEDYFTTADIDTDYDEMMSKYQRQLAALQKYLNLRRAVWAPKKETNEMRASELQEARSETWTAYFTDGTKATISNVNDETDPARVRAFLAKKGKTVVKFDYGYGVEPETGPGPEPHEPGSGRAVSARTGDPLPEADEISVTGQPIQQEKGYYSIWAKKGDRWAPVTKHSDRNEAEKIKRGLEHQGMEVIVREGRAGYNPMNTEKDWHEVERQLSNLINDRTLDPESRAEARQRYLEKRREAQQKGWAK
jgi:hypothetical protein